MKKAAAAIKGLGFLKMLILISLVTACTKTRKAELPEDAQENIFEIAMFGAPDAETGFIAAKEDVSQASDSDLKALNVSDVARLSAQEVNVPERIKFMFNNLPMTGQAVRQFKITFSVDQNNLIAYKVAQSVNELNAIEKSLAVSLKEAQLTVKKSRATVAEQKKLSADIKLAAAEREQIKAGQKTGTLLVPLFSYQVRSKGILERTKNELKEETATLRLKQTSWEQATHIEIGTLAEDRKTMALESSVLEKFRKEYYDQNKLDKRVTTAAELGSDLKIGLKFLKGDTKVITQLSATDLLVYEITDLSKLTDEQRRIYLAGGSAGNVVACSAEAIKTAIKSTSDSCVVVLVAKVPVAYKKIQLDLVDANGKGASSVLTEDVPKSQSVGLVEILENSSARQLEVTGLLDPDSTIKISDLEGEFMFRRTFEDAASSFLGRTGTSGDMVLVKFELEDDRLVVRNQMSLIRYTGQGAKDREEIMSIPVRYFRIMNEDAHGSDLVLGQVFQTTKEKANYIMLDWTSNRIPDSSSPLAFFDAGGCFIATASSKVTNTDMRLAKDGVLNFSISSSHTVNPSCAAIKDVNSAYWAGTFQLNFNVVERISFVKRKSLETDKQFSQNISYMAQEAFNFGVFTLADKVTDNGSFGNRDGSEKYMPMIHDLRNGKKLRWYLGGINDAKATTPSRRQLLVDGAKQVIAEWNNTFRFAFRGTSLERADDYIELIIEEPGKETGRLGDLDKNYIWLNEIPADNGLLGVAQPAANPRSGVIESANVIVYTGNTFDQTQFWMKMTEMSRQYEKMIDDMKKDAIEKAKAKKQVVSTATEKVKAETKDANKATVQRVSQLTAKNKAYIQSLVKYFELDHKDMKKTIQNLAISRSADPAARKLNKDTFRSSVKSAKINLPLDNANLSSDVKITQKLMALAADKRLVENDRELELRVNDVFLTYGKLGDDVRALINKRQQILSMAIRFDRATQNRPGCFRYSRNEINDASLPDPSLEGEAYAQAYQQKLMDNFKQSFMTTLSHELGHAYGLMHNFKASTDQKNFEFKGEETGRNYSSVMDYMNDIDQHYAGPGPYDAHAIRAAYTGYVELDESVLKNEKQLLAMKQNKIGLINGTMIHMNDLIKLLGNDSYVHFTKETLNKNAIVKHYEQCSDGGTLSSIMCNRFDIGGSAVEIVKNKIADYNRNYATRNYVYDRILFGWPQKLQLIQRNIGLFSEIRAFLDETIMTAIYGSGRPETESNEIMNDLFNATLEGYRFFHELLRTPETNASFADVQNRFFAVPYQYEAITVDDKGVQTKTVKDEVKVVEARSLYDVAMSRDKMDTVGIGYDKIFAMSFLMQTSSPMTTDDSQTGFISYKDFEQFFLGVEDPRQSLTINTMTDILTSNLQVGFFAPNGQLINMQAPVEINKYLGDQTALASVVGLSESKWKSFDAFAESFKMARSTVKNAPKDRLAITRLGQDRSKADTTVFFATQNGVAADAIIRQAARGDVLLSNKTDIFGLFDELYKADRVFMDKINAIKEKACAANADGTLKDEAGCNAAYQKPVADYIKEDASLLPGKQKADAVAKKLVSKLRQLNAKDALMPGELDKPESKTNFAAQVELIRSVLNEQLGLLNMIKAELEKAPAAQLNQTIQAVLQIIQNVKGQNDELSAIPTVAFAQSFMVEVSKSVKITFQTGEELAGERIMTMMMDGNKIQNTHEKIVDVIDQLTQFSRFVDPDLIVTK